MNQKDLRSNQAARIAALEKELADLRRENERISTLSKENTSELAAIYDNAPVIMILVDEDRRVRKANRMATAFSGRPGSEMFGLRGGDALRCLNSLEEKSGCGFGSECRHCTVRRTVMDTLETGRNHDQVEASLPFRIEGKERTVTFLLSTTALKIQGSLMALVSIMDISSRRQSEFEQRKLVEAVRQASDGIVVTEPDGTITYANPAFEKITGYDLSEIMGASPRILKSGQQDEAFYKDLWRTILSGRRWRGRLVNRRKDGRFYSADCSITPVTDAAGDIVNFVWLTRDISAAIQMEDRLSQAQKMEAIGTLAGGIAHDFNNILFPLVGFAEMLKADLSADSPLQDYVDEILHAALRSRELVQQILTFSHQTESMSRPMRLQPVVREAVKLIRAAIPKTIQIKQNISPDCRPINGDPVKIHQIVMNLCTNAYHAMEETGGLLNVSLAEIEVKKRQTPVAAVTPGTYVLLRIADSGVGMEKEVLEKAFDPYYTTKKEGKGTGLGLSVVRGIVDRLGGSVRLASTPGKGTSCRIYFPVLEADAADDAIAQDDVLPGGTERIMIVDDEEAIVRMLGNRLRRLGYTVSAFLSGSEALTIFKRKPDRFDLLITDMTMPEMTGIRLAREVKGIRPQLPIIIFTGFSEKLNAEESRALGLEGFLMKPVTVKEMAETVRDVLDRGPDEFRS